ncbi:MAG: 16S rRNA (cytosine(967)-C(5))-methyltransferase RsmB [Deltaproteobacteria bacterium]|nr:16S rRNA (cytosine(967)-C(5))-methyltransferase RsmB [Deltaproteobacteria bacterium]
MTARAIAFKVLLQVERADAYLNVALDAALRSAGSLPRQDAALATEIAYGTARRRLALDAALARHSKRPLHKLETAVLVALRVGAYQLLYLERVPSHAAVDATVEVAKKQGLSRASGFINAVLRRIAEDRQIPLPDDPLERVSVETSHPIWLVRRWAARLGAEETGALCRADNEPAPVCVRVNRTRATREEVVAELEQAGVVARPTPYSPLGLWLESPGAVPTLGPFRKGLFQVQDEAAQLVSLAAAARPGMRVLDACAAPGAKACHLAEQMRGEGEIFAIDVHERKLRKLEEEAHRLGVAKLFRMRAADASRPMPLPERSFALVRLAAPCSGLGTRRRHPELRYRREEGDLAQLATLQQALSDNLVRYLKPGGTFVYAVCSPEPEEGTLQSARLVSQGLQRAALDAPEVPWEQVRDPDGGLATLPHRHRADGFYAARFTSP